MWFFNKKKEPEIAQKHEVSAPKEFNTFGLHDLLHYIKREIGVDLFAKNSVIETKATLSFCLKFKSSQDDRSQRNGFFNTNIAPVIRIAMAEGQPRVWRNQ